MKAFTQPFQGRVTADSDTAFEYRRKVGLFIKDHREALGLTQRELGEQVGVINTAISAIELGRNPIPPERFEAFATALKVDPKAFGEFLLEWTNPWLFTLIYGKRRAAKHHLNEIPSRLGATRVNG